MHRADLITALSARLDALQHGAVQTGCPVLSYAPYKDGAEVILTNGQRVQADLVIGADGVHSNLRHQMLGPDAPRFTGNYAWRALVPAAQLGALAPPPSGCIWAGPKKHAVTTFVRGGTVVNFVGIVEQTTWREESWSRTGDRQEALADFDGWAPPVSKILQRAEVLHKWALFDRAPLPKWQDGHVVLLGDAAHPMLPHLGQGANQAIEDGMALAIILAQTDKTSVPAALDAYEKLRRERVADVQQGARQNGLRVDSMSDYADLELRDAELAAHADFRKHLYAYDVVPEAEAAAAAL